MTARVGTWRKASAAKGAASRSGHAGEIVKRAPTPHDGLPDEMAETAGSLAATVLGHMRLAAPRLELPSGAGLLVHLACQPVCEPLRSAFS